jgi:PAS domain S-box-containing protein
MSGQSNAAGLLFSSYSSTMPGGGDLDFFDDDLDMDFKLLSEYLFDDNSATVPPSFQGKKGQNGGLAKKRTSASTPNLRRSESIASIESALSDDDLSGDDFDDDDDLDKGDDKAGTGQRVDKRRERNRVLARKTRLRRKFFFESLQRQVAQLTKENETLKGIAKQHLKPDTLRRVLSDTTELPACVVASTQQANSIIEKADYKLMAAIQAAQRSFCITDPSLPDNPIVFVSQGFLELTGYTREQVVGRNCRFLQGPKTDPKQVETIRNGILEGKDTYVTLLNYKADGAEFLNQVFTAALRDESGKIVNFVGVQLEIKNDANDGTSVEDLRVEPAKKGRPRTRPVEENPAAVSSSNDASYSEQDADSTPKGGRKRGRKDNE